MVATVSLNVVQTLLNAIKNLCDSAQSGRRDGPLVKHLAPTNGDAGQPIFPTHEGGPYYVFNSGVFQKQRGDPDNKLANLAQFDHQVVRVGTIVAATMTLLVLTPWVQLPSLIVFGNTDAADDSDNVVDGENDSADENEVRRKKARQLIRPKVSREDRHLVLIRSMKVRWNTTLAVLERAQVLHQAFDVFRAAERSYRKGKEGSPGPQQRMGDVVWELGVAKLIRALDV
ncbi:hypothetical protein DFH07DRAFT_770501 [Mycena maculata]|uniref:Uncharacterized protein n=1 Tax=Mycena maculata TaxID=230809 RepID=A0AAD7NJ20_9AGAR|nr:hypothetical protein DFH07DRAFT_770501 [Mycena maculata]